ncbi:MAG: N-acetylmuramoyl-L-alanine amidase [Desulfobulbaceae bacterium]|nr:N-acetylmuramoyl-L-alanine amidase [Desulfobulbaceae bacterium]HIJ79656.1 AMIN domain-containing protein [Deltaproteobacteria bacterium]
MLKSARKTMTRLNNNIARPSLRLIIALLLLATNALAVEPVGPATISKQYGQAKAFYQNLTSTQRGKQRDNWKVCAKAFRQLYKKYPNHEVAPKSLFMLGKVYHHMYDRSNNPLDLGEAIAYYEDVATLYPKNSLADDALYAIGRIYLEDKKNSNKAAATFAKIAAIYPDGDMVSGATHQLQQIKGGPEPPSPPVAAEEMEIKSITPRAVKIAKTQELPPKQPGSEGQATILPLRHWSSKRYTRVVVETTEPVTFKHQILAETKDTPRRLYIDLLNSRLSPEAGDIVPIEDGLLRQVRNGQHDADTVRVVLDTQTNISDYKVFSLVDPFRVVIDVMSNDQPKAGGPSGEALSLVRQLGLGIRRIVIDPGHGGKDPGTCSAGGLKEKDIVLKVARKVAAKLKDSLGCDVVLTRNSDIFIPLEERTAIANSKEGDLFLSIHVNAAPQSEVRGIETYVLDLASNKDAMRLAAQENATSTRQLSDLQSILVDLLSNSKLHESVKLAELVQEEMVTGLGKKYNHINNLGVKKAPFIVLIGAQMPAILTEIAFMSNPVEEKHLKTDKYLSNVAEHIVLGVSQYVDSMNLAGIYR